MTGEDTLQISTQPLPLPLPSTLHMSKRFTPHVNIHPQLGIIRFNLSQAGFINVGYVLEVVLHESASTLQNGGVLMTPATMVEGNEIEGIFCLTFDDYNATDYEMEKALEALLTITSVDLECGAVDNKLVLVYSDTPTYSSASSMANMTLDDGNELGDRFKLEYNGMGPTGWIDCDAIASVLTFALEQLGTIPSAVRLR